MGIKYMKKSEKFKSRFKELATALETENFRECAQRIGISVATFSNAYYLGILPPTVALRRIANYFDVSVDYLIGKTDEK